MICLSKKIIASALIALFILPVSFIAGAQKAYAQGAAAGGTAGCFLGISLSSILGSIPVIGGALSGNILSAINSDEFTTVPVRDVGVRTNTQTLVTKELNLDCFAYVVAKAVLSTITDSIVQWIQTGFQGGPFFVEDPAAFFADIADQISGQFIAELGLSQLCSPFRIPLLAAIKIGWTRQDFRDRYFCTISRVAQNVENFFEDLTNAGIDDFIRLSVEPHNQPFAAFLIANRALDEEVRRTVAQHEYIANWGNGFLSEIVNGKIVTPGKVIESQLENVLGSSVRQLELADEINEIVSALVAYLVQQVLTSGQGLAGYSP